MKLKILFSTLFGAFLVVPASVSAGTGGPLVRIDSGMIEGIRKEGIDSFRGIPFAAPPVSDLRWRAPQPVKSWRGVRPARENGNDCAQLPVPGDAAPLDASISEDCLYLNVWRPRQARNDERLPVMVWIHGGGFVNGGVSPSVFDGTYFARQGVIIVGINYRLGRFGFFAHPALTAENKDGGLFGNYGLMDEIAALEWIRRNISAFGGDPAKVTIFGESAGGMSVNYLLTSKRAHGLFQGAIIQSGGGRANLMGDRVLDVDRPGQPSLQTLGVNFAKANGIDGMGAEALARLRALPADKILNGLNMLTMDAQADTYGGPILDGVIVPESPETAFINGRQAKVPVIVGATDDDLGWIPATTKEEAFAMFGAQAGMARATFDTTGKADDRDVLARIGQVRIMIEPARFAARSLSAQGLPVYAYRFSYVAGSMRQQWIRGAPHASDVPYAMGTVTERYGASADAADRTMGRMMNAYWVNFARTGDPNGPDLPVWEKSQADSDKLLEFKKDGRIEFGDDPRRTELDLVEQVQSQFVGRDQIDVRSESVQAAPISPPAGHASGILRPETRPTLTD